MKKQAFLTAAFLLVASVSACGTDTATDTAGATCSQKNLVDTRGKLDVRDPTKQDAKATPYLLDVSALTSGKTKDLIFTLANVAEASLAKPIAITGVDVVETDDAGVAVTSPQFQCVGPDGQDCAIAAFPVMVPEGFDAACAPSGSVNVLQSLTLRYTRPPSAKARHLKVSLHLTGDPDYANKTRDIFVDTSFGAPKLSCTPSVVDFGVVAEGAAPAPLALTCKNLGTAPVLIYELDLAGTWYGAIDVASQKLVVGTPVAWKAGQSVEAGGNLVMSVSLDADKATLKQAATLSITSNDPTAGTLKIPVRANSTGPCLQLAPTSADLGPVGLGQKGVQQVTLTNCGQEPLTITGATFQENASPGLTVTAPGGLCGTALPNATTPWVLQPKTACAVQVEYAPAGAGVTAAGTLQIDSDAGVKTVPVSATGVAVSCGSACFTMKVNNQLVGNSVVPQQTIQLDGSCSTAAPGQTVATWSWTLQNKPAGFYGSFAPAASGKVVTFVPKLAGTYTIKLDTADSAGAPGCQSKSVDLIVVPDDKLHVELTWTTAGDKDPTDTLGTDLDLHLAHQDAYKAKMPDADGNGEPDPWGNLCDCFVTNAVTDWGDASDSADNAVLALDDHDGWGPENININVPQVGYTYAIGVRYWYDKPTDEKGLVPIDPSTGKKYTSMGPSVPRVLVYLDASATPQYKLDGPAMSSGDMWCVGEVTWHTNAYVPCKGADAKGVLLTPYYPIYPSSLAGCK